MRKLIYVIAAAIGLSTLSSTIRAETLKICSDVNFWYPFTMVEDGKAVGIHIDVIREALASLGMEASFRPLPWKRCLNEAKRGYMHAVATASYKDDRAEYLHYPEGAKEATKSPYRVTQVEYVIVTSASDPYEFDGDVTTIPTPIRAPRGYSIVSDLESKGLKVDSQAAGDVQNIKKLFRSGKGSLVTYPAAITELIKKTEYKGKLKISSKALKSKSYYLPFSKESSLTPERMQQIWDAIAEIRDNPEKMAAIAEQY